MRRRPFGSKPLSKLFGPQTFGARPGMYNSNTIQYPPGINCILSKDEEIDIDQWTTGDAQSSSNLAITTGAIPTVIGIYYPSWYNGPIGTWTEAEIREKLTNDIEKAIDDYSNGECKLVGPNGGPVMIDGPKQLVGTIPNTFQNYH